jgi:membrane protein YqaA with SNARE-associated domain
VKTNWRLHVIRLLVFVFVISLTVTLYIFQDQIQNLGAYGYPGIFILSILANATIIIPLPGVVLTAAMAVILNPFWVAIAAGTGAALGELSGYLAGFSGQAVVEKADRHERLVNWMRKYGEVTILVLAFIPNPAFDMAGITAGALKMPVLRFLFWVWLGKLGKMLIIAYGGEAIAQWFIINER